MGGKGSRSGRCLCDTTPWCTSNEGLNLGGNGYDRYMVPSTDIGEGYCAQFKELPRNLGLAGCFSAAAVDGQCANKNQISYGKGSRSGRCLCDTTPWCTSITGQNLGASGYDRHMVPQTVVGHGSTVVGAGYCAQYKELPRNLGLAGCFTAAAGDYQCANKNTISYGKGSRSGRCLCDTTRWCTSMDGLHLGGSGYDRYMVPPSVVGAGYCAQYKELPRNMGLAGCFAAAARDMQCVNKHHISYGKGSRSGRCLCDTSLWCTSMEGLGLGNSGYDRYIFAR